MTSAPRHPAAKSIRPRTITGIDSESWRDMSLLWKYFALGFSALLPLVNPLGSALVFLGLVGVSPHSCLSCTRTQNRAQHSHLLRGHRVDRISPAGLLRHLPSYRAGLRRHRPCGHGLVPAEREEHRSQPREDARRNSRRNQGRRSTASSRRPSTPSPSPSLPDRAASSSC